MGFNAEQANTTYRLDYDFTPFVDAKGTSPEPSDDMIQVFRDAVNAADKKWIDPYNDTLKVIQTRLAEASQRATDSEEGTTTVDDLPELEPLPEMRSKYLADLVDAVADVVSQQPTAKEINALPAHLRWLYVRDEIIGNLLDPENRAGEQNS